MSAFANFLYLALYALLGVAVAILAPLAQDGLDPLMAALAGVVVFFGALHCHGWISQKRAQSRLLSDLDQLWTAQEKVAREVEDVHDVYATLKTHIDETVETRNANMVSQLKMVETLLRQVVDKSGPKGGAARQDVSSEKSSAPRAALSNARKADDGEVYAIMQNALQENRVDLYLQPIVALPQRKVRHYEAFTRVRDAAGAIIYPVQYLPVAEESGLIATLDNLLLFSCIRVIRNMKNRRSDVRFFCNVSSASLRDADFFPQFVDFIESNPDLADRLVLEFAQNDIEKAGANLQGDLDLLGKLGFRFSMDHIADLDMDLAELAARHFEYVKVPPALFVSGQGGARPRDFKLSLERAGIDLIVEKIEDERTVVNLLEFDVDYGQGYLFGEPRQARDPAPESDASQPAARTRETKTALG